MKIVIQIPCYNEAEFIGAAVDALPREVPGADSVEVLVIDDGSSDGTAEAARRHPRVTKVLELPSHQGLAAAFKAGLEEALRMSADVIVNTDADNQYPAGRIADLVKPVLERRAEFVIGCRDMDAIAHFSSSKKFLQRMGSKVVSVICGRDIPDVTSGFRAFGRDAALWVDVIASRYTYTLETLVRLAARGVNMEVVTVRTNPPVRESRLMKSSSEYVMRSVLDILRLFYIYSPLKLFFSCAAAFLLPGLLLLARFFYHYVELSVMRGLPSGYTESLTVGTGLVIIGVFMLLMGVISDLIHANRKMLEAIAFRQRRAGR